MTPTRSRGRTGQARRANTTVLAAGERVFLRAPRAPDGAELTRLNRASLRLHRRLIAVPRRPAQFASYLRMCREPDYVGLLVCRVADRAIVGAINFFDLERGIAQAACVGYYVGAPFAGRGYMTEALGLALRHAFARLRLHRVEAYIEPDNAESIRLVRRAGFTREGVSRRYLKLRGRWRDHERWALLAEEWRARTMSSAVRERRAARRPGARPLRRRSGRAAIGERAPRPHGRPTATRARPAGVRRRTGSRRTARSVPR